MLVLLDCLLFREEAYRHLLFHRYHVDLTFDTWESKIILLIASSFLRAYVVISQQYDFSSFYYYYFMQQVFLSGAVYLLQIGCIAVGLLVAARWTEEYAYIIKSEFSTTQVCLSMLLPTACHGATIFVQIWEDSDTVRWMGSCLILAYQWFALRTVLRGSSVSQTLILTIVFVMSLMIRDVFLEIARLFLIWGDDEKPLTTRCPGVELKLNSLRLTFASEALPHICLS